MTKSKSLTKYEDLPPGVNPWLTKVPHRLPEFANIIMDGDNEEYFYTEAIREEIIVDLRNEEVEPDLYWAEGWIIDEFTAVRHELMDYGMELRIAFQTRYRVADFKLNRSYKRIIKKNDDLKCVIRPFRNTAAKTELGKYYRYWRFNSDSDIDGELPQDKSFRYPAHHEMSIFHPSEGLIGYAIIEIGERSIFGRSIVWSPTHVKRSLGTYLFLKSVEYAQQLGCDYYYVGPANLVDPTFNYKLRYPACEIYDWDANEWLRRDTDAGEALLHRNPPVRPWDKLTGTWKK